MFLIDLSRSATRDVVAASGVSQEESPVVSGLIRPTFPEQRASLTDSADTTPLIRTLRASQVSTPPSRLSCDSYTRKLFTRSDEAILQAALQCGR
jgi:hypothetical protein